MRGHPVAAFAHGFAVDNRDRVVIFRSRLPLPGHDLTWPPVRSLLVLNAGVLREAQADCIKVTICSRVQKSPDYVRCTFDHCLFSSQPLNFLSTTLSPTPPRPPTSS